MRRASVTCTPERTLAVQLSSALTLSQPDTKLATMEEMVDGKLGRPTKIVGNWRQFADELGGIAALGVYLDVGRKTIWRWATGATEPTYLEQLGINQMARARGCPVPCPKPQRVNVNSA